MFSSQSDIVEIFQLDKSSTCVACWGNVKNLLCLHDDAKFLMEYDKFQHKNKLQSFEKLKG